MQITQVQVGNYLYPLTEGLPLQINVGQTLKVFYAFKYQMPQGASVRIWASLYRYTAGILDRASAAQTKQSILLEASAEPKSYAGEIDVTVGQVSAGTYGLICELPDYKDAENHIDDCITVAAAPSMWGALVPLIFLGLMVGMVSMMAPMMKEEAE